MPDEGRVPISEMTEVTTLDNNDVVTVVHTLNGTDTTMKAKMTTIGTKVNKEMQFASDLQTTNKTIIGAINELNAGGSTTITGTLTAGNTTLTLTNAAITTTATYFFFTDTFGVNPTDCTVSTGSLTLTFDEQSADVGVKVEVR